MVAEKTIPDQVKDMEARAKRCGVSVQTICDAARIARSTWECWKSGKFSPRVSTWATAQAAFIAAVEASDPGPTEMRGR
ncbi:MAG: hypothetical protein Q8K33_01675 [Cypionkella sp.]|uniref:hypothetical protein n=1 Tax=Cypionkella sp. TaxID=2811411 RepID=UPI002731F06E|nr:hypothetical protein [Cypionkella sp.]MDP2047591.1 hypothetical protein [Cypionkella sp.]